MGPDREYRLLADAGGNHRIINSSELRAAGFTLREAFLPEFEAVARRRSVRGAGIRQLEGMGPKRFILSVDDDTEFRS